MKFILTILLVTNGQLEKNTKPYDTLIECEGGRDYIISKMPSDAVYDVFCNPIKITQ